LQNYTLGPPLQTYGPNIKVTVILCVVGLLLCLLILAVAVEVKDLTAWTIFYLAAALFGGVVLRQLSSRAWLHETGISWRGISGQGEMWWRDLERMYFGSYEIHAHYIPLGTFHRLRLVSARGQKVSLGERIGGADDLAREIAKFTWKLLLEKAMRSFENSQDVDFGKIIVSRKEGVRVRTWYDDKRIAWQEIESYEHNDAYFKIHRIKKRFAVSVSSEKIANAYVLHALLDGVMHQVWQRGPSPAEGRKVS
jgi:hypothetical protein